MISELQKLTTSNVIILKVKTIKYNLNLDQGETLSLQLNLIYGVLSEMCSNKLDIYHSKQIAHKWYPIEDKCCQL